MSLLKKITSLFSWIVVGVVLLASLLLVLSTFDTPVNVRVFSVLSGSMEPEISTGALVAVVPQDSYQSGDIITVNLEGTQETVTHRIVEVTDETFYQLKGDANEGADPNLVSQDQVVGKVVLGIPYLGRMISFVQTQQGFLLLIVIPGVILVYSELMNIKKEAQRLIKERKKRKLNLLEKAEVELGEKIEKVEEKVKEAVKK